MALSSVCKLVPSWAKTVGVPRTGNVKPPKNSLARTHSGFRSTLGRTQSRSIYSINKITLLGNVGADPQTTQFADGTLGIDDLMEALRLQTLAWPFPRVTRGEKVDRTDWFRVAVYHERLQEVVQKMVLKGSRVYVEGQLKPRKWVDATGVEKLSVEVVIRNKGEVVLLNKSPEHGDGSDSSHHEPL